VNKNPKRNNIKEQIDNLNLQWNKLKLFLGNKNLSVAKWKAKNIQRYQEWLIPDKIVRARNLWEVLLIKENINKKRTLLFQIRPNQSRVLTEKTKVIQRSNQ
jgi:hypothetical protein